MYLSISFVNPTGQSRGEPEGRFPACFDNSSRRFHVFSDFPAIAAIAGKSEKTWRSEEHTSELQSPCNLVCRLLLEKKKKHILYRLATEPAHRRLAAVVLRRHHATARLATQFQHTHDPGSHILERGREV